MALVDLCSQNRANSEVFGPRYTSEATTALVTDEEVSLFWSKLSVRAQLYSKANCTDSGRNFGAKLKRSGRSATLAELKVGGSQVM